MNSVCSLGTDNQVFIFFPHFVEMIAELLRREKESNIKPDPDIDVYMKVRSIVTYKIFVK